ncbi:MAG TPA: extracellular solute-binding protein [Gaiellaceae bacterium]|nr:extracellular solute-binding protein [Gaiellaceae bacterium]
MKAKLLAFAVLVLVFVPAAYSAGNAKSTAHSAKKANASTTIVVYASGDVNVQNLWQNNIIPHFEKENKGVYVKFIFSIHGTDDGTTLARIGSAVKGRHWPGIDLIDGGLVTTLASAGLNQPVSKATAPNIKKVNSDLLVPVKGAAIPYRGSSVVLAYNTDHVKSPPKTLADLLGWIKANPGKFTYNSPNTGGSGYSFAETVVDSFISAADLKQMDQGYVPSLESDWKQGLDTLHSLNKYVYQGVYPNGNAAVLQLLAQGQIWVAPVWSDQALTALSNGQLGPNIKLTQVSSPSFTGGAAYLAVPKTARHKKVLYKFVNYILSPEAQQMIVNVMSGFPAINLKYMGSAIQQKFEDVSANTLRPTYSTKQANDFKAQWQQTVP